MLTASFSVILRLRHNSKRSSQRTRANILHSSTTSRNLPTSPAFLFPPNRWLILGKLRRSTSGLVTTTTNSRFTRRRRLIMPGVILPRRKNFSYGSRTSKKTGARLCLLSQEKLPPAGGGGAG